MMAKSGSFSQIKCKGQSFHSRSLQLPVHYTLCWEGRMRLTSNENRGFHRGEAIGDNNYNSDNNQLFRDEKIKNNNNNNNDNNNNNNNRNYVIKSKKIINNNNDRNNKSTGTSKPYKPSFIAQPTTLHVNPVNPTMDVLIPKNYLTVELISSLEFDYARFGDRELFDKMLKKLVVDGDNVGEDEYDDEDIESIWASSEIFKFQQNAETRIFITISPCFTSRTVDTCQVSPIIVYDNDWIKTLFSKSQTSTHPSINSFKNLSINSSTHSSNSPSTYPSFIEFKESLYITLVNFSIGLAKELDLGYTDCILKVCPDTNPVRVDHLRDALRFELVASVPESVLIGGRLLRDFVLVKRFAPLRKPRSEEEVVEAVERLCPPLKYDPIFDSCTLPQLTYLPRIYILPDGKMLYIRNVQKTDADCLYSTLKEASDTGRGYGLHEFPTPTYFKAWVLMNNFTVVYHLFEKKDFYTQKDGGIISHHTLMASLRDQKVIESLDISSFPRVAYVIITESWHVRSASKMAAESCLIVDKRYRNQKIGKELLKLELGFISQLGFKISVNDSLSNNAPLIKALNNAFGSGYVTEVGNIPNVCYIKDEGWVGQKLMTFDLVKTPWPHFTDLVNLNNKNGLSAKY